MEHGTARIPELPEPTCPQVGRVLWTRGLAGKGEAGLGVHADNRGSHSVATQTRSPLTRAGNRVLCLLVLRLIFDLPFASSHGVVPTATKLSSQKPTVPLRPCSTT
jgi:hypothetical protein